MPKPAKTDRKMPVRTIHLSAASDAVFWKQQPRERPYKGDNQRNFQQTVFHNEKANTPGTAINPFKTAKRMAKLVGL